MDYDLEMERGFQSPYRIPSITPTGPLNASEGGLNFAPLISDGWRETRGSRGSFSGPFLAGIGFGYGRRGLRVTLRGLELFGRGLPLGSFPFSFSISGCILRIARDWVERYPRFGKILLILQEKRNKPVLFRPFYPVSFSFWPEWRKNIPQANPRPESTP
jgi:hypothetical protein